MKVEELYTRKPNPMRDKTEGIYRGIGQRKHVGLLGFTAAGVCRQTPGRLQHYIPTAEAEPSSSSPILTQPSSKDLLQRRKASSADRSIPRTASRASSRTLKKRTNKQTNSPGQSQRKNERRAFLDCALLVLIGARQQTLAKIDSL